MKLELSPISEAQDAFLKDETANILVFSAGFGAGKSTMGGWKILIDFLRYNNNTFLIVAPTFKQLREGTLKSFRKLVEESGLPIQYNHSTHTFTFTCQTEGAFQGKIICASIDTADNIRGLDVFRCWIDEAVMLSEEAYFLVDTRIREPYRPTSTAPDLQTDPIRRLYMTTTPNAACTWLYDLCRSQEAYKESGITIREINSSSYDNPLFPREKLELHRQTMTTDRFAAEIMGKWTIFNAGSTVFKDSYSSENLLKQVPDVDPNEPLLISIDPGFTKAGLVIGQKLGDRLNVLLATQLEQTPTDGLCDYVLKHLETHYPSHYQAKRYEVVSDVAAKQRRSSAGFNVTDEFIIGNRLGKHVKTLTQAVDVGMNILHWLFRAKRLMISPAKETDVLIQSLVNTYRFPETLRENSKPNHEDSHVVDALRYLCYNLFWTEYRSLNTHPETRVIRGRY